MSTYTHRMSFRPQTREQDKRGRGLFNRCAGEETGQKKRESEESLPKGACGQAPAGLLEKTSPKCFGNSMRPVINPEKVKDAAQIPGQGCVGYRKGPRDLVGWHAVRYQS